MSRKLAVYLKSAAVLNQKKYLIQQIKGKLFCAVISKRTLFLFKQCVLIFKNAYMTLCQNIWMAEKYLSKKNYLNFYKG